MAPRERLVRDLVRGRGLPLLPAVLGVAALAAAPSTSPPFTWLLVAVGLVLWAWAIFGYRHLGTVRSEDVVASKAALDEDEETERSDRRAAIKLFGLGLLGAAPVMLAPPVMDRLVPSIVRGKGLAETDDVLASRPVVGKAGRVRQWTMIIDLRYCDGCQSQGTPPRCTTACIEGHYVPSPMEWIEVYEGELVGGGTQFIPAPCQQCQNPPCVNVCPVGATFSSPEGTVLIDQERCIGCRICMAACPYDRRFFNWGEPPVPPEALLADYNPDHQIPARRGTVMKCDFCPDMVRAGTLPFCVQGCPNDAIWYGDLEEDIATNGKAIVRASRFLAENGGYRLKEHLGTEPRVYYIPGHGEAVGRDPFTKGRMATEWPWVERAEGAAEWSR